MATPRITLTDLTGVSPRQIGFVIEYVKDCDAQRAAIASGYSVASANDLMNNSFVKDAIFNVLQNRMDSADIDAEWLKMELVDNHNMARQTGKLSASNTALGLLGRHAAVDAFAAERVEIASDEEVRARLLRARDRMKKPDKELTFI